eukprot:m.346502 g.346502  ORF g.346502 m.346502 type:complete len:480 (+) comp16143_c0_seq3:473-1912(+)
MFMSRFRNGKLKAPTLLYCWIKCLEAPTAMQPSKQDITTTTQLNCLMYMRVFIIFFQILVLNKVDMFPADVREEKVKKAKAKLAKVFSQTRFKNPPMVVVSANPGSDGTSEPIGIPELIETLRLHVALKPRLSDGPFQFAVDHCFTIKGQGTIMTGTVLKGAVHVGDDVEFPSHKVTRKIKSMQMFRKPVQQATQGDRLGLCVTQFQSSMMERGVVCTPGSMSPMTVAVAKVQKIRFFKQACQSKQKFHISVGHTTVMATATFFQGDPADQPAQVLEPQAFDASKHYLYQDELLLEESHEQWCVLEFQTEVVCANNSLFIASRLDADQGAGSMCRLAFHGSISTFTSEPLPASNFLKSLQVYKPKQRVGTVERLHDDSTVIGKDLFKKETNIEAFVGMAVRLSTGQTGRIESAFGQSGKFKVALSEPLPEPIRTTLTKRSKKKRKGPDAADVEADEGEVISLVLDFKRFVFDKARHMAQ